MKNNFMYLIQKLKKFNIKIILMYIYTFYIIYTPSLNLLGKYSTQIIVTILLAIMLLYLKFVKKYRLMGLIKDKKIKIFFIALFLAQLYFMITSIINGTSITDFMSLRIIHCIYMYEFFLHLLIIYNILLLNGFTKQKIIYFFLNVMIIQSVACIFMVIIPSLKGVAIKFYNVAGGDNIFVMRSRIYGITMDYTFGLQIMHGVIAGFALIAGIIKDKKLLIYSPLLLIPTMLNGRTGLIVFIVATIIALVCIILKKGHKKKLIIGLILGAIVIFSTYKIVDKYSPNSIKFIKIGIEDTKNLFQGKLTGNYDALLNRMLFFPKKTINVIFGCGHRVYAKQGAHRGYNSSDIGYINDIFMGGIIYILILYTALIYTIFKDNKYKSIKIFMLISFLIINFKGEFFRNNAMLNTFFLVNIIFTKCLETQEKTKEDRKQKELKVRKISNEIKISIIVPVYNAEKTIKKCVSSLRKQTYKNIEIILIDDGSIDATPSICDQLQKLDKRIKVLHKKNEGVSAARNKGLTIADGDYITFCDSDDTYDIKLIENYINILNEKHYFQIVTGYTKRYVNKGKIVKNKEIRPQYDKVNKRSLKKKYSDLCAQDIMYSIWNKLYDSEVIIKNKIRFDKDYKNGEDTLFNIEYLSKMKDSDVIYFDDSCMYNYYIYMKQNSLSKNCDINYFVNINKVDKKINEILVKLGIYSKNKRFIEEERTKKIYNGLYLCAQKTTYSGFKYVINMLNIKKFNKKRIEDILNTENKYLKVTFFITNLNINYITYKYFRLLNFINNIKYKL